MERQYELTLRPLPGVTLHMLQVPVSDTSVCADMYTRFREQTRQRGIELLSFHGFLPMRR